LFAGTLAMFTRATPRGVRFLVPAGLDNNQTRAVAEFGYVFGNNIVEKKP